MSDSFFSVDRFSCGYSSNLLVKDISFAVPKGSFAGIIGPNGVGKTTLFKGITGELKYREGSVCLDNTDLNTLSYKQKAQKIAIVSQAIESLDMLVEDFVLLGRMPYHKPFQFFDSKDDIELANYYLELTGVDHLRGKYMNQLSGGEQQLVAIARALTQEPQLLLLDEPTAHLDITHAVQILNLLQRLNKQMQLTVVMVIHDLNLAGEYCDYLIMMCKGKVFKQGESHTVLNYKNIEEVYNTVVVTQNNPISDKPVVFYVSEQMLARAKAFHLSPEEAIKNSSTKKYIDK